jgi:hypothetical protein
VILEGIRQQQQEAQRQQMLQHQMMTTQMFMSMSGCLGQFFQQSGMQLLQFPTAQQLQADPTAPLPPASGFVNIPLASFPQSPLLQTGMFAVPQTTTPQAVAFTTFLDQLQMATPTSSQLSSPLTTGALVLETPARTSLPSPRVSSPLPSFTTPRTEGLGQEDHYLRVISEQISSAIASDPEVTGPEATQAPTSGTRTTTVPPPLALGSSSPTWPALGDDSDDDDTSSFSVRPSRTVSTSPPDPSSSPQA